MAERFSQLSSVSFALQSSVFTTAELQKLLDP